MGTAQIKHQDIPVAHSDDHFEREEIILTAIARCKRYYQKTSYAKIIYIGDREWDKKAADNLGIGFIGIGNEFKGVNDNDFMHITNYNHLQLEKYLTSFV